MKSPRIAIFGNSGSGKSTLARKLAARHGLEHVDLDHYAWSPEIRRRPVDESLREIRDRLEGHEGWVAEGCYADLIEPLLGDCTRVVFLNPGVETCVQHCRKRPWEPDKYASPEEQDTRLEFLIEWVRNYETRDDEFSLRSHRRIFDAFAGPKDEIIDPAETAQLL